MNNPTRRYIVDIHETDGKIIIYQTLPAALEKYSCKLGEDPPQRLEAVGFLAGIMQLLPLAQFLPGKSH